MGPCFTCFVVTCRSLLFKLRSEMAPKSAKIASASATRIIDIREVSSANWFSFPLKKLDDLNSFRLIFVLFLGHQNKENKPLDKGICFVKKPLLRMVFCAVQ